MGKLRNPIVKLIFAWKNCTFRQSRSNPCFDARKFVTMNVLKYCAVTKDVCGIITLCRGSVGKSGCLNSHLHQWDLVSALLKLSNYNVFSVFFWSRPCAHSLRGKLLLGFSGGVGGSPTQPNRTNPTQRIKKRSHENDIVFWNGNVVVGFMLQCAAILGQKDVAANC